MRWLKDLAAGLAAITVVAWLCSRELAPSTDSGESTFAAVLEILPPDVLLTIDGQQINVAKAETAQLEFAWNSLRQQAVVAENQHRHLQHRAERCRQAHGLLAKHMASPTPIQSLTLAGREYSRASLLNEMAILTTQIQQLEREQQTASDRAQDQQKHVEILERELSRRKVRIADLEREHAELLRAVERSQRQREAQHILEQDSRTRRAESSQQRIKQHLSQHLPRSRPESALDTVQTPAAAALLEDQDR